MNYFIYINWLFILIISFFHFKYERVHGLINTSNGKVTEFLLKYVSTPMDDSQLFKLICDEHKKLQQELYQILASSSLQTNPTTTFGSL
jgi:hypothetical protein